MRELNNSRRICMVAAIRHPEPADDHEEAEAGRAGDQLVRDPPERSERRGTLKGHQIQLPPSRFRPCYPTDPNFDCTWTCSHGSDCPDYCID
jgi:hypothetical protein